MKEILLFITFLAAIGLWVDDYSKRAALTHAQAQIQSQSELTDQIDSLTSELNGLKLQIGRPIAATPLPSPATWFQQRLNEHPKLDPPKKDEHY